MGFPHRGLLRKLRQPARHRVTNGAIVIHTQRLKSDPGGNLLS
ncbi:chemotaxis protein [Escherichia coli]|nr:chemotaxis protein [Escherichia coli]